MKDIVKYFVDLGLLSRVNGAKHPASPPSMLSVAADKKFMAFLG